MTKLSLEAEIEIVKERIRRKAKARKSTAADCALLERLTRKKLAREVRARKRRPKEAA